MIMSIAALLSLSGCTDRIKLPDYIDKECYYGKGIQDYTDFCKYYYNSDSIKEFENHSEFNKVKNADIENIRSFFMDFETHVENQEYFDHYDFDCQTQIKADDFFCISTKEGKSIGDRYYEKFDSYDVFYFDTEKCILYYIHSNN